MDELITPREITIQQHQLEKKRKHQQDRMNRRLIKQHFDGVIDANDKGSAFRDTYTASVYAQIRANDAKMKDNMVQATGSAPYHQKEKKN